jgi:O-antigen ligase
MIRYTLLTLAVTFLVFYAYRDWYRSLCGLLVLMAFIERYDMPRQMLGITGLNPWNILMLFIMIAWFIAKRRENLKWDFPKNIRPLLFAYLLVILIGFVRMLGDLGPVAEFAASTGRSMPGMKQIVFDELLNTLKYVIPGLLMFHGCNSRSRLVWGVGGCLLASLLLGAQIIKWMPISDLADAEALSDRALRVLDHGIGYHRVDLAAMMASASWSFLVLRLIAPNKLTSFTFTAFGFILVLSLALTGGRAGYVSWIAIAMLLAMLRWRRLVFVMPVLVALVVTFVPAARDRMLQGFGEGQRYDVVQFGGGEHDYASITSDRILIWPSVIDAIEERPFVGYGRKGYHISGASREIRELYGEKGAGFPHPHNAYLEILIDNGIIGAMPVLLFFFSVLRRSAALFRNKTDPLYAAVGGISLAFVFGQLVASIGAQSFYPRAGVVLMWATIGLALRAHVMWQRETVTAPAPQPQARAVRRLAVQPR